MPARKSNNHKAPLGPARSLVLMPGDRVWAYLRHSPGDEQDIVSQRRGVREYCEGRGLLVEEWWVDEALTGSTVDGRDSFARMISASHQQQPPPVKAIVVWRLNRFARNDLESQFYMADLRLRGYEIVSIKDEIPDGEFAAVVEAFIRWKDARYLLDLQEDVRRGHDAAVFATVEIDGKMMTGFSGGGCPPVGYNPKTVQIGVKPSGRPKTLTYWVETADVDLRIRVKKAWRMAAEAATAGEKPDVKAIHRVCRLHKHTSSYYDMLRNVQYTGVRRVGERRVADAHFAYVTKEEFEMVQHHLPEGKLSPTDAHPKRVNSVFMLSGKVFCGLCGARIDLERDNKTVHYATLRCSARKKHSGACTLMKLSYSQFMDGVLDILRTQVITEERFAEVIGDLNMRLSDSRDDAADFRRQLVREIAVLSRSIGHLLDLVESGEGSPAIKARLLEREREKLEKETLLSRVAVEEKIAGPVKPSRESIRALVASLLADLDSGDEERTREILNAFIVRVELTNEAGRVQYTLPANFVLPPSNGGYEWRARGDSNPRSPA